MHDAHQPSHGKHSKLGNAHSRSKLHEAKDGTDDDEAKRPNADFKSIIYAT